ncbi:MAG: hypothetical protein JWN93_1386 [Hyphomicrobiales bacterium]|nr:hypothetical protein [Hyphomicrobiales bacterium]
MAQTTQAGRLGRMAGRITPLRAASGVFGGALAIILGAWGFEWAGYAPCELCLMQRWAYYVGVPLAALAAGALAMGWRRAGGAALALLAAIFFGDAVFAAWHAGVEWGFWPGPAGCTGAGLPKAGDMSDFLRQIETTRVVRCDEVAIRIAGLSLAGWNAIVCLGLSLLAALGARNAFTR